MFSAFSPHQMADSTEKLPIPGESMSVLPIVEYPSEKEEAPSPVETAPLLPDLKEPEDFYNLGHHIRVGVYCTVFISFCGADFTKGLSPFSGSNFKAVIRYPVT